MTNPWIYQPGTEQRKQAQSMVNQYINGDITSSGSPSDEAIAVHEETLCGVPRWYLRELAARANGAQVSTSA